MPKVDLIATRDFTYNTRRLKAGEPFQARNGVDASILIDIRKKATYGRTPGQIAPPPAELQAKLGGSPDISGLRKQYFELYGKRPFNGWDAETLLEKMAAG